uniref:Class II aldolase n=1 Tax=uncultured Acidilobus sp. TaxID=242694 RepID=A0A0K2JJS1_9CREN|nr:class II aldolase [uncultured Acidilobus sp.]
MHEVADVARQMYARGLTQIRGGNVSVIDRQAGVVYITPTGVPRHLINDDDVAVVSIDGKVLVGTPSSELKMHLGIYRAIQQAKAIVHVHPINVIALYETGRSIDVSLFTESMFRVKCVAEVPPMMPGTEELANAVSEALSRSGCNAAVLRKHGIVTYSAVSAYDALDAAEALSDLAYEIILLELLKIRI